MSEDISYDAPASVFHPDIGARTEGRIFVPPADGVSTTYANIPYLRQLLSELADQIKFARSQMELSLAGFSVPITDAPEDEVLRQANESEWPSSLGPVRQYITYKYYQLLGIKTTKSAAYIRQRYEDAVRDVSGNNAIDLIQVLDVITNEIFLIQDFLDRYVGNMDDPAEFRATELFQDWAETASVWSAKISSVFQNQGQINPLPDSEVDQATEEDARKAQALFKVKLNSLNDDIQKSIGLLKKNYSDYADVFMSQYLGPALQFRLDVSRTIVPTSGMLGKEMFRAAGALDTNLSVALADQLRRNRMFQDRMDEVTQLISMRDTYRGYIQQLAVKGRTLPTGVSGTTVDAQDSADQLQALNDLTNSAVATGSPFVSSHDALDGRDSATAHSQYLLRNGGTVTGDIAVTDLAKIDGVDLDLHAHSGRDGSAQIDGNDIKFGTLSPDAFNVLVPPPTPTNFHVVSKKDRTLPGGVTVIDVVVAWESPDNLGLTYEVNIAPVT